MSRFLSVNTQVSNYVKRCDRIELLHVGLTSSRLKRTLVNGVQIKDKTLLKAGDRIKIGSLWVTYCDEEIKVEPQVPREQFGSD